MGERVRSVGKAGVRGRRMSPPLSALNDRRVRACLAVYPLPWAKTASLARPLCAWGAASLRLHSVQAWGETARLSEPERASLQENHFVIKSSPQRGQDSFMRSDIKLHSHNRVEAS